MMLLDGYFNSEGEPAIELDLGAGNVEVLIDTGFAGWLIVPASFAIGLSIQYEGFEEFSTATGQTFAAPICFLEINWFDQPTRVPAAISPNMSEALLGGSLLRNCHLSIDYYDRTVRIIRRQPTTAN